MVNFYQMHSHDASTVQKYKSMKKKVQVVICLDAKDKNEVLLFKTNKKRGSFWQNITGGVDKGESFEDGAIREVFEESSIKVKESDLINLKMDFVFESQWGDT